MAAAARRARVQPGDQDRLRLHGMSHDGAVRCSLGAASLAARRRTRSLAHVRDRRLRGDLIDLTESNPTRGRAPLPDRRACARRSRAPIRRRLRARAAGAAGGARRGRRRIRARRRRRRSRRASCITASSSESCSFLFKLLCDPGDAVLVPEPSYPLYDYLAHLDGVVPVRYRLAFDGSLAHRLRERRARRSRRAGRAARGRAPSSS